MLLSLSFSFPRVLIMISVHLLYCDSPFDSHPANFEKESYYNANYSISGWSLLCSAPLFYRLRYTASGSEFERVAHSSKPNRPVYQHKRRNICDLVQRPLSNTFDGIVRTILCKKLLPISKRQEAGCIKET